MKLESLPNEILLDVFSYFNGTDLLRAFYGLNIRLNLLLSKQFYSYSFQFNYVSKRHFDQICQQHLPLIANRVVNLQLSNSRETPEQMNLFFTYIPSLKSFIYLQSLTIFNLQSYQILVKLLDECRHLSNLTRLRFYSCTFRDDSVNCQWIIDQIWSLPKLVSCHLYMSRRGENHFYVPTIQSRSLEHISLFLHDLQWNDLNQLIESTPNLKSISTSVKYSSDHSHAESVLRILTKCTLYLVDVSIVPTMNIAFPSMSGLRSLDVYMWDGLISGCLWERIIRHSLPQLKIFHLTMEKIFFHEENLEEKVDELFNTFGTSFWIDEHQWFVRCFTMDTTIYLSTRFITPYCSDTLSLNLWRSTYPDDDQKQFYNNITRISNETFFDKSTIFSNIRFSNIEYLCLKLPFNDQIYSIISDFKRLKTLSIVSYVDRYSSQLQTLLGRVPCLQKLSISQDTSLPLQSSLFKQKNTSIRELHFFSYNCYYFNENECLLLICSPLAIQCEVLSIQVQNRQSVISLVKNLLHLRSLIVTCQDDQYEEEQSELVTWLKKHLSSKYLIVRDPDNVKNILIWI